MTDYNTLSDFEINKRVAGTLGLESGKSLNPRDFELGEWLDMPKQPSPPDYCNNPSDAWSIIINNGISICYILNRKIWQSSAGINPWCHHDNPLRAAMICFLMMNEA